MGRGGSCVRGGVADQHHKAGAQYQERDDERVPKGENEWRARHDVVLSTQAWEVNAEAVPYRRGCALPHLLSQAPHHPPRFVHAHWELMVASSGAVNNAYR